MASHTWCDYKGGVIEKHPTYTDDSWENVLVVYYTVKGRNDLAAIEAYRRKSLNEFEFTRVSLLSKDDAKRFVTDIGHQWLGGVPMADSIGLKGEGQTGLMIGYGERIHPAARQFFELEKETA